MTSSWASYEGSEHSRAESPPTTTMRQKRGLVSRRGDRYPKASGVSGGLRRNRLSRRSEKGPAVGAGDPQAPPVDSSNTRTKGFEDARTGDQLRHRYQASVPGER